jgi:argininosuccinate lyase
MKLWDKGYIPDQQIEKFTIGKDNELDLQLAPFDVLGSLAHVLMLGKIGLLSAEETRTLTSSLKKVYQQIIEGNFSIIDGVEDIHSQVEMMLTEELGGTGRKVHAGRSRNDQVLLDLRLFLRDRIEQLTLKLKDLFDLLISLSEQHRDKLMPGYTHTQLAMPSSFGLWLGAFAESLTDDTQLLLNAYRLVNRNPLGSGAGYGSSFPLDREYTTQLLGFESLSYNVIYAQMGRGKMEWIVSSAMASAASTLSKLAGDAILFMNQHFGFISFPDELTTGSSIMPHKKNPDVFELIRARCNRLQALPNEINLIRNNLMSGYHRDYQLLKESLFPAFDELFSCIDMSLVMFSNMQVKENLLEDSFYDYLFSVEEVNKLVLRGIPFREAYQEIAAAIQEGRYKPEKKVEHTHAGSTGNLSNDKIAAEMDKILNEFNFPVAAKALEKLLLNNEN